MKAGTINIIGTIGIPVLLALIGYFATSMSTLATRVDALQTSDATQQQATRDIDSRLTRIEDKLDSALQSQFIAQKQVVN